MMSGGSVLLSSGGGYESEGDRLIDDHSSCVLFRELDQLWLFVSRAAAAY